MTFVYFWPGVIRRAKQQYIKSIAEKSVFNAVGRTTQSGQNPASSTEVAIYVNQIKKEQSRAHVQISQAKPIFL
jgi:hypothetical protein